MRPGRITIPTDKKHPLIFDHYKSNLLALGDATCPLRRKGTAVEVVRVHSKGKLMETINLFNQ